MLSRLFQRRTIWWPTPAGWLILAVGFCVPATLWFFLGEGFLARSNRLPAEALIVEGWIGIEGVKAAKFEFETGGYRYLVAAGGLTENRWGSQRWNYATEAHDLLLRLGVPADRVINAPAPDTKAQRTFASAITVRQTLEERGLHLANANVFTLGVHARRSRLIFAKALPGTEVGVVSWTPSAYSPGPWWRSSERAEDLIKETAGWLFEALLNSGRMSNSPAKR